MKKYPKLVYAINTQSLIINMEYDQVEIQIKFGSQCSYLQEEIGDIFPEPLFDELCLNIFVESDHGHGNLMVRLITGPI